MKPQPTRWPTMIAATMIAATALAQVALAQGAVPAPAPAEAAETTAQAAGDERQSAETRTVAYLGITAEPPSPALAAQVDLPEGVGLVVSFVEAGSPADAAGLKRHDIVHRLGEQILITPHQLKVLIRLHEPKQSVTFQALRKGQPTKIEVALGSCAVPATDQQLAGQPRMVTAEGALDERAIQALQQVITQPGQAVMIAGRQMSFSDGQHKLIVRDDRNGRHLRATNRAGEVVFEGYITSRAQRRAMPEEIARKVERLDQLPRMNTIGPVDGPAPQTAPVAPDADDAGQASAGGAPATPADPNEAESD